MGSGDKPKNGDAACVTGLEAAAAGCGEAMATGREAGPNGHLKAVLDMVRTVTGHDFGSYKTNTLLRRIDRRMTANGVGEREKYLALLKENRQEAEALSREFLIGVTSFFRDADAFEVLRRDVIPRLFTDRDPAVPVRIWHACCATGEEVYSTAMLIREYLDGLNSDASVQIFATDLDDEAIAQARSGLYTGDIRPDVSPERLAAFFTRNGDSYQVAKQLREMVVFAQHNLIKDPPFSRLDLVVCRNFLIYLDSEMQGRVLSLFRQVLKPGGFLFLGGSETAAGHLDLFIPVDKKWKIYRLRETARRNETPFTIIASVPALPVTVRPFRSAGSGEKSPGSVAEKILMDRYSPPCVVINERYEVIYVSTRTGCFLEVPVGEPTRDILKMVREELRLALRAAIHRAFTEREPVAFRGVNVTACGVDQTINLLVEPLGAMPDRAAQAMVIFEPVPAPRPAHGAGTGADETGPGRDSAGDTLVRQLEEQLRVTHEQLQAAIDQLQTSNEAFMSTNDELVTINEEYQSTNEELQATNEELETSKEELQVLNEELATTNAELQFKVEELNELNSDMENLFASSQVASVFLDLQLVIRRFSPAMADIFNLIPTDIGRPFRHMAGTIDWPGFVGDATRVLENLIPVEREVAAPEKGRTYLMRVLPYLAADRRIDGVVVTLFDITEIKRAEAAKGRLAAIVESSEDAIIAKDLNGVILSWNAAAENLFGYRAEEVVGRPISFLFPTELVDEEAGILRRLSDGERIEHFETRRTARDGRQIDVSVTISPIKDSLGRTIGVSKIVRDISARKKAEEALRRANEEWERTFDSVPDLIAILDERHRVLRVNRAMAERLGKAPEQCLDLPCHRVVHGTEEPPSICPHSLTLADGMEHELELEIERLGGYFLVSTTPLYGQDGRMIGTVHVARDISERKKAEEEVLCHVEELERFNRASVGRELRMIELKKEVNALLARLGEPPRYSLEFEKE